MGSVVGAVVLSVVGTVSVFNSGSTSGDSECVQ